MVEEEGVRLGIYGGRETPKLELERDYWRSFILSKLTLEEKNRLLFLRKVEVGL